MEVRAVRRKRMWNSAKHLGIGKVQGGSSTNFHLLPIPREKDVIENSDS